MEHMPTWLDGLVVQLDYLYGESLFVSNFDRLCREADRRLIPVTGTLLPAQVCSICCHVHPPRADSDEPAPKAVHVTIPAGKIIALVSINGSAKSTPAKLLCGLYASDSGRILWDDVDATEANRADLFDRVPIVTQDFYRWPFTVCVNIPFRRPDAAGRRLTPPKSS
ncbi:ATP-binding cassette domain-containing protein [Streptomyces sp. MBT62]|uniref:ATP-binding cassette domain-containing protein n=1 Tax=Streptomyces sp. MBT62 TaxID=2800410 RepID=UPI001F46F454|nr:ATP-binding cassette domain-containing protein [Streptomyces sp. MBT62]